ncbi:hypothetical protein FNF27_03679 [Cafeteria roenbergensis]|uniref:Uncharacterized protein n=1 Tax=Cafeteria roenbergensis TaxID=33653 RepID=A0A5A8EB44_CAFRO|nr:hypothetical protein FNF27_03679 [Cafeteria roenbergensis]
MRISVSFRTESNDIAFGAFSRLDGATTELRATARVDAHVLPQFFETAQQERDVTVALLFDNSYSYLTAKTLRVTVCVETAPPAGEHAGGGFLLTRFGAAKLRRRRAEDDVLEVDLPGGGIGYMHASNCVEVPHGVAGSRFELDAIASVVRLAGGAAAAEAAAAAARDAAALAVYKPEEGATSQAPAPADAPDASGTAASAASAASAAAMDLAGRIASGAASALRTATATASSALAAAHSGPLSTVAAWLDDLPAASGSAIAAPASAIIGTASLRVARRFLLHHGWQTRPAAAALLAAARWRAAARAAGTSVADVSRALAAMPVFCPGRDAQGRLVLAVRMAAPGGAALASAGSAARGPDRLAALVCGLEAVGGLALHEASSSASAAAAPATSAATSAAAAAAAAPPAPVLSGGITLVVDFTGASSAELSTSFFQRAAATLLLRSLDGGSGDVDNDDDDDVDADLSIVAAAAASAPTGPGVARPGHLSRVSDAPPPADSPASDAVEVVQWGSLSSDDAPAAAARGGELLAQAMDEPAPLADALGDDEVSV